MNGWPSGGARDKHISWKSHALSYCCRCQQKQLSTLKTSRSWEAGRRENNSTGDTGSGDITLKMRSPIFSFPQHWYSRPVWLKFAAKFPVFLGNGCVWFSFEQIGGFSESRLLVVTMVETKTTPQSSFPGMESGRIASPDGLAAKCELFLKIVDDLAEFQSKYELFFLQEREVIKLYLGSGRKLWIFSSNRELLMQISCKNQTQSKVHFALHKWQEKYSTPIE